MRKELADANLIGIAVGIAGAYVFKRFLQGLLFQVKTTDWKAYLGASAILTLEEIVAALIPVRRGSRVGPMVALRE